MTGPSHALVLALGLAAPAAAQMDITDVSIGAVESRTAGVLDPLPYTFEIEVEGAGIAAVSVVTPSGALHNLVFSSDGFRYEHPDLASLAAMAGDPAIGFGNFAFNFIPIAGSLETATVDFNPGLIPPHTGYAGSISPQHGTMGVPQNPTFTWACSAGPCGAFAWFMEVFPTAGPAAPSYEADLLDPAASSWAPGCLAADTDYGFWISSGTILGGVVQPLATTPHQDAFFFAPAFETTNEITFTTGAAIGTSYCGPAAPNSSGAPATICAAGSTVIAAADLHLYAAGLSWS